MARIDVDVDVDDILWSMSTWEKQEMANALYDDGVTPEALNKQLDVISDRYASTNLEQELSDLLDKVWTNRLFLNNDDIQTITALSKKSIH
jgi:hypothetical protein